MNDSAIEKKLMEDYHNITERIQLSDTCRRRLMNMSVHTKHTKVGIKILLTQVVCLILLFLLIPASAFAMVNISDILLEKVKDAKLNESEIIKINNDLQEGGYSAEEIRNMTPLEKNEFGQTYGLDVLGADLIAVISEEGLHGYVYREELEDKPNFKTPEEAIEWQNNRPVNRSISVYKSDGRTVIGEFVIGNGTAEINDK
ncbi:hypothetical protein [Anaerocolumna sp. MB42-C2]|uniref:hypothetical protein n=1 Tax=Anaerocolumna sp. MB42-C2 TaxID=3070997 RepID=UPI0027E061C3|nr:hypothetical protein [Anaerocolumna sp. MB42-C2]WMJ85453.1 hypothetical protein RBU59_15385 [Anaerocolumna sp. MB42-C2]